MKTKSILFIVAVLICFSAILAPAQEKLNENTLAAELKDRVEVKKDYIAIVVGIVDKKGVRYYKCGTFSKKDLRPVDENTIFEIGSITKTFTGILLADMNLKGEVNSNDPVEKYLPDGVKVPEFQGTKISLLNLTVQDSGLPRMLTNHKITNMLNPYWDITPQLLYDFLNSYKLTRKPGELFEYSNLGVGLLGHVLSLKAGVDYETLVQQRILSPLGMTDTRITLSDEDLKKTAVPYSAFLTPVKLWDIPVLAGAGALRSTAKDMIKYLSANMGLTETPLKNAMDLSHTIVKPIAAGGDRIGYNWITTSYNNTEIIWHNGGTGGFRSFAGFCKEKGIGVVVWTNCSKSADDIGFNLLANAE